MTLDHSPGFTVAPRFTELSKLAKQAGISIDTIRYYEREGLIASPPRRASGYRDYTPDVVSRPQFINRAKVLGFTPSEITEPLSLTSQGERDMAGMKVAAQAKLGVGRSEDS